MVCRCDFYAVADFLFIWYDESEEVFDYMRKFQKQQILDVIVSLHTLHGEIRDRLNRKDHQTVQTALKDCQEAAIQVGEAIEQIEGTAKDSIGTEPVSYLEQYCERLYQLNEKIEETSAQKAYKLLEESLIKAENAVNHMPVKKIALFLPYKASMWDSFESVWKAASEDGEWKSLVMPIPYFNKNDDGTVGEMEYEGLEFPFYVPILDWQQYSLEREHPDIIFIHNPYDQYNFVTTIHPAFYASKIKEYADKLVYIPYFVHQNDVVSEHYCVLPGTLYADVVILQSDKVRQQYIKYYEAALPELVEKLGKDAIEQKFQALGSPKFDVSSMEKATIPEEWQEFLDENKKVIFF